MKLLDYGFFRHRSLKALTPHEELAKEWKDRNQNVIAWNEELAKIKRELEKYSDYSTDMLPQLRVEQIKLDVDIVGAKAIISKCEEIPQPSKAVTETLVLRRIELIGLQAKQAKLEEYVAAIKKKNHLVQSQTDLTSKLEQNDKDLKKVRSSLLSINRSLRDFSRPTLEDDKITIYPVERVPPKAKNPPKAPPQTPLGKTGNPG